MPRTSRRLPDVAIAAGLALAVAALYAPVRGFGFVNYDDNFYVVENPHVVDGLRWTGMVWAFTAAHAANWHPLTWLSHMLDATLFGTWAGGHHLVNVALHALNAALLYGLLARTTGARGRGAFVAAVFALHPLRVESVAWIAERKDVLSGLCWMLALASYARYAARPSPGRYLVVVAAFAAGLLAKPMVVTLPLVLLLLDWWPLDRPWSWRLLSEKVPLVGLSAAASVVTIVVQHASGAMPSLAALPFATRLANALVAYAVYLQKTVWPTDLAVFYPIQPLANATIAGAVLALVACSAVAATAARTEPAVAVGWLWFLGTLVPVIGLVKAGDQALADRFTYLPQIGLLLAVAWGGPAVLARLRAPRGTAATVGVGVAVASVVLTAGQLPVWHDSVSLFEHALRVTTDNAVAEGNLGAALVDTGRPADAVPHLARAVALHPDDARLRVTLGRARADLGDRAGARAAYDDALRVAPDSALPHYNLAVLLAGEGQLDAAIDEYRTAIRLAPDYVHARHGLADALAAAGRLEEAVGEYRALLALAPNLPHAHGNLAIALERLGRSREAVEEYRATVRLAPDDPIARFNLAAALVGAGAEQDALAQLREAVRLRPGWPEATAAIAELEARARGARP